jgi:hypothetical protein
MDPPRFSNRTDFVAQPLFVLAKGGEVLVTVVKATLVLPAQGAELEVASKRAQRPLRFADVPWGDPTKSSIKYPADICAHKPGTDVIVVAEAHAPEGRAVPSFDVAARVGRLEKVVRVFGLRVWGENGGSLSAPRPIEKLEVRYDFAWGGLDASDEARVVEEPRNPVGMGIARDASALTHQPAPFLEDPARLIASAKTRPPPAGLGAIGRHWEPRRSFLGTYDEAWAEERAPLPPLDEDDRLNNCASPGLVSKEAFTGGEEVSLLNLVPGGGLCAFRLPRLRVKVEVEVKGRSPEALSPHIDTVLIDTLPGSPSGLAVIELVFRAAVKAPRRLKDATITVLEEGAS